MDDGEKERLYFVIETKGTSEISELRPEEKGKIHCAREHFSALGTNVDYHGPIFSYLEFQKKANN
jgi:type III restriction enzyme